MPQTLEIGGLEWLEQVHSYLSDGSTSKALRIIEHAIEKRKLPVVRETVKADSNCPDCFGSGFRPKGPERGAPVEKCDHRTL